MTAPTVLPSSDDPVVAGAVELIGGPPGRFASLGRRAFWTPVRVLVALTLVTCVFGWLQKSPCRDGGAWQHEFQYTRACYTDVVALYSSEGLSDGKTPYYEHPVEYPVVIGGVMEVSSWLARHTTSKHEGNLGSYRDSIDSGKRFFDITWALLTACAIAVAVTTARLAGRRPWDAAMFALAPALVLHGTTNWDLLAVALAGMGLLAWANRRPVVAGVLIGLATATKLYPILFLIPLFLLCVRARTLRSFFAVGAATVLAAVAVTLPVYLTAPSYAEAANGQEVKVLDSPLSRLGSEGLSALEPTHGNATNAVYRFFFLNKQRPADWDSLYLQLQHLHTNDGWLKGIRNGISDAVTDTGSTPTTLNAIVAVLEIVLVGGLAWLTLQARRRPRLPQLLFLMVTGFLLVNKVDSPQYVLWLVPLAVLARPRWRAFIAWQAAEVAVVMTRFYFFVANDKPGQGIDIGWFFGAVLLRDAILIYIAVQVIREIWNPERDVVRAGGVDDPAGGVLSGAPA